MKKIVFALCFIAACTACKSGETPIDQTVTVREVMSTSFNEIIPLSGDDVVLLVEDIVSKDTNGIVYTVTNNSSQTLTFGDTVRLYRNKEGELTEITLPEDSAWFELGNGLEPMAVSTGSIDLGDLANTLPEGSYRLERYMYSDNQPVRLTGDFAIQYNDYGLVK